MANMAETNLQSKTMLVGKLYLSRIFCTVFCLFIVLPIGDAWNWIPEEEHPCNVRSLQFGEVYEQFGPKGIPPLHAVPLVIRTGPPRNDPLRAVTTKDTILEQFAPDFNVTLSSSNALSEHRRTIPFRQYLDEIAAVPETTPGKLSNESWYLFGETYTEPWQHLLLHYELPPCQTCIRDLSALSFGIGNRGSGVQWHIHGPGFSEALHGRKHWILYPPHHPPANLHKDKSSREWMELVYPVVLAENADNFYECTLNPGDIIYFPDRWWHATINLDPYTAFLSTFTTEHGVTDEL